MTGGSHRRAAALCLGLASAPAWAGPGGLDGPEPQAWLGHSRVGSVRQLPILGALRTRTDTWVLARVVQDGDRLLIEQIPCAMEIKPVAQKGTVHFRNRGSASTITAFRISGTRGAITIRSSAKSTITPAVNAMMPIIHGGVRILSVFISNQDHPFSSVPKMC